MTAIISVGDTARPAFVAWIEMRCIGDTTMVDEPSIDPNAVPAANASVRAVFTPSILTVYVIVPAPPSPLWRTASTPLIRSVYVSSVGPPPVVPMTYEQVPECARSGKRDEPLESRCGRSVAPRIHEPCRRSGS